MDDSFKIESATKYYKQLADKKIEEGDYFSALSLLLTAKKRSKSAFLDADIASLYEAMGNFEKAINYWFKYMAKSSEARYSSAYIGLASAYTKLGNVAVGSYYFNEFIKVKGFKEVFDEDDVIDKIAESEYKRKKYKIVYPADRADYKDYIEDAKRLRLIGKTDEAIALLSKVDESSKEYSDALSESAIAHFVKGDYDSANSLAQKALDNDVDNFNALADLAGFYFYEGKTEIAGKYYDRLKTIPPKNSDQYFTLGILAGERSDHETASKCFSVLLKEKPYDVYLNFLSAVAEYNLKNYALSKEKLFIALRISEVNPVLSYYYQIVDAAEAGMPHVNLSYLYRLPQQEEKQNLKKLYSLYNASAKSLSKKLKNNEFSKLIDWCFFTDDPLAAKIAVGLLVTAGGGNNTKYLLNKLLDASIASEVKEAIVLSIVIKNEPTTLSLVTSNIFKKVRIKGLPLVDEPSSSNIIYAYARCLTKLIILGEEDLKKLEKAVEDFYFKYCNLKQVRKADTAILAATLLLKSEYKRYNSIRDAAKYFEVKFSDLKEFLSLLD